MYSAKQIGKMIRMYRSLNGYSQAEFAKMCGVHQQTLKNIEYGGRFPRGETIICLAKAMGISLTTLFGEPEMEINQSNEKLYHICANLVLGGMDK